MPALTWQLLHSNLHEEDEALSDERAGSAFLSSEKTNSESSRKGTADIAL